MTTILGLDAAWTAGEPTGVALVAKRDGRWRCLALAPSYESFIALSRGNAVNWAQAPCGSAPDLACLLEAASKVARGAIDIVAVDMPVSLGAITGRRAADRLVSREFGSRWCSAHSPTSSRPGIVGAALCQQLAARGYSIATADTPAGTTRRLVEVYPHVSLLELLTRERRVPYKLAKSLKYWPATTVRTRIERLLAEMETIDRALRKGIAGIDIRLPSAGSVGALSGLKRYEDALDALVCCWSGIQYVNCNAIPLGDNECAIWCPRPSHCTNSDHSTIVG